LAIDLTDSDGGKIMPYEASVPLGPFLLKPLVAVLLTLVLWWSWPSLQDHIGFEPIGSMQHFREDFPLLLLVACSTFLAIRIGHAYAQLRIGHRPPQLVRQMITLVVGIVGLGIMAGSFWDVPIGSLMTTSGLLVAAVGIALKNMISDLVNGISLPVKVGDWIDVASMRGQVVEISWRATKLVGTDGVTMTIPNTHFITHPICNFSPDKGFYMENLRITLPAAVTAYQAERILMGAAHQVEQVARLPRMPEARILNFNHTGVEWELRFPVPDMGQARAIKHQVQRSLMRDLYYSGIEFPVPQIELHRSPPPVIEPPQREELTFLSHIDLFGTLTVTELDLICSRMRARVVPAGKPVVTQGDNGDSLFIVQEGLLIASIAAKTGSIEVGRIRPGQFFGEMSLLTGAARSASVTPLVDSKLFEIDRDILAPILQDRPEIAAVMSSVLAERQLANAPKSDAPGQLVTAQESLSQQILGHITAFFRLQPKSRQAMV
jgi:small-conductance mechanosensitive channel